MASVSLDSEQLDLKLFEDTDDEEDTHFKQQLLALVSGDVAPPQAAIDFDAWVMGESNRRLHELLTRPKPSLTAEEVEQGIHFRSITPNASGYIDLAFPTIARLCSAFPPFHPGQDRLINFLEELRNLPQHEAPDGFLETQDISDEPLDGIAGMSKRPQASMITLWPFGEHWQALTEVFRREWEDLNTLEAVVNLRDRNFQFAVARITVLDLVDCGFLCALGDIIPGGQRYLDLESNPVAGPKRMSTNVIAATPWILWPDQGRYVYRQCKKVATVSGPRTMWSMERWNLWKEQFVRVSGGEIFDDRARIMARLAVKQMMGYEEEDVS